jgi:hypothetical protein
VARDDKKNPLISTFDWTDDAAQRILRVPAGFMRNNTQERVEGLARERAVATIDLALVEEGIEVGRKIMAEVIANYNAPASAAATAGRPASAGATPAAATTPLPSEASAQEGANGTRIDGRGYLNEVSPLTAGNRPATERSE